jgi:hypothetical protein
MNYYVKFKNYTCYLLGENHDDKKDDIKNFVQQRAKNALVLLEAPYFVQKEIVKHNYTYQENSQILSLQNKYHECLFCNKGSCPLYLFHIDLRCCDIGEKYLAKELTIQLADYQSKHNIDSNFLYLLKSELPLYFDNMFSEEYTYDITKWQNYLHRKDSTCYILHDNKHPLAYYHEQLSHVNNEMANNIYQKFITKSTKILNNITTHSLIKLSCLLVDTLILYQILLLDNCDPLNNCRDILVVVGSYHVKKLKKYLTKFQYHLQELH